MTVTRLTLVLLITATACAAEPIVVAQRAEVPPTLDGRFDDEVWRQAQWYTGFTMLGEVEKLAEAQTRFAVAYDDTYLYIVIHAEEPHMDRLRAEITERDGRVHTDDCVEFMIDPSGDRTEYYHFAVNSIGTLYDAELLQGGHVRAVQWDCNWRAEIVKGDDFWAVEAAIPFVELGLNHLSRGDWAINVARERYGGGQELSSFTPAPGGFHQPTFYAQLQLPEADLDRFMWTIREPFEVLVVEDEGRIVYTAKTHVTNHTGRVWLLQLVPELIHEGTVSTGEPVNLGIDDGQGREVAFSVPVEEQGAQVLRLRLVDRRDPERVLHVRSIPTTVRYTPLVVDITRPHYRNNIYATQQIDEVELTVTLALADDQLEGRSVTAAIFERDGDGLGATVVEGDAVAAATEVHLSIPATDLPVGDYLVGVRLADGTGAVEYEARTPLRRLPPPESGHEWRFDENWAMLRDGEPFLPFGWFSYRLDSHTEDSPYTAMQDYNANWRSVEDNLELFDRIAEAGLVVTVYPYSRAFMNRGDEVRRPLNEEEAEALRERVTALMDHEALMAWYMADEPELRPVLPRRAEQIHEVVAEADPYHPTIMLNNTIAGIHTYAGGGDILMPDPYPLFLQGGLAARGIERTSEFVKASNEAARGRQAVWITPQAFNYGDYGRAGNRAPNFTELRNQCYQAVVYGVKGFLWYTHGQAENYPALGIGMDYLCREALDLQAAILAPDAPDEVSVDADQPEHMHVAVRRAEGELYVFAVSTATEPQQASIAIEGLPERLHVVGEGRQVQTAGGAISDGFDIYATHIYTTNDALADRPLLETIIREIAEADAARKKPGNLAFEDRGVEVTVSSGARYGNTPARVVDGVETGMGWRADHTVGGEQWLALHWPEEESFSRVIVYTTNVLGLQVQVPTEGEDEWATVAEVSGEERLEVSFDAVTSDTLRLVVTEVAEDTRGAAIQEVEVYAQ